MSNDTDPKYPRFGSVMMAVFNCTPYGKKLGRKAVLDQFGESGWQKVVVRMKTGIMEIFHHHPIPETKLFTETVGIHAEKYHIRNVHDERKRSKSMAGK